MKTPLHQLTILYQRLNQSALKPALSGTIYLMKRPDGSELEDVVINSLPVTGDTLQLGVANVNLYVPDLKVKLGGKSQTVPNLTRLQTLTDLATEVIADTYTQGYTLWVASSTLLAEPETAQHYMNFRIEFRFQPL